MSSGNILIGENLSMDGFDTYVRPVLEREGYSVTDKLSVNYYPPGKKTYATGGILISLIGNSAESTDLEAEVSKMLVTAGEEIKRAEAERQSRVSGSPQIAYKFQVSQHSHFEDKEEGRVPVDKGQYDLIGVYQNDHTASQLFPSIAQGYLVEDVEFKAKEALEGVKALLDRKLSEL